MLVRKLGLVIASLAIVPFAAQAAGSYSFNYDIQTNNDNIRAACPTEFAFDITGKSPNVSKMTWSGGSDCSGGFWCNVKNQQTAYVNLYLHNGLGDAEAEVKMQYTLPEVNITKSHSVHMHNSLGGFVSSPGGGFTDQYAYNNGDDVGSFVVSCSPTGVGSTECFCGPANPQ